MDAIVIEFEAHLAELARVFAGAPEGELDALWIVGIEREAIVSVAYRSSVIEERLRALPIDDEARAVIARAIRWAWRDEEAHTLWVRGALLRRGDLGRRARAIAAQIEGWVGGWVSSRQSHLRWRQAPLRRMVAEAVEIAGVASGKIPEHVRETLHFKSFGDYCRFSRAAETTAAMAWRRMAALSDELGQHDEARAFEHMAQDEERHAKIFTILAGVLDASDRLVIPTGELRSALGAVGQRFVAVPDAGKPAWRSPLGKGATVAVREGRELAEMANEALGALTLPKSDRKRVVAIKTTFMLVTDRKDPSPGVSMDVLRAVIAWFRAGGDEVRVIDSRNMYDRFHEHRSVAEVAAYLGLEEPVVDAQADQAPHPYARGMGVETISRTWRDADVRVLVGKLRSHPTAKAMLSLEAAEGLASREDGHLFSDRRAERETAILMALDAAPADVAVLDVWQDVPDGLMGVFGTDRPLHPRRLYASTDAVALDAVVARHVHADPNGMLLEGALDWFGDPRAKSPVDGPDDSIAQFRLPTHSGRTALLSALALPVFTHASGRGALFMPRFDEAAFPPIDPPSIALAAAREAVRRLVDDRSAALHHPQGLLPTRIVQAPGAVRVARIGSGPPVVLLHGYPETLQVWAAVAPRLAARREVVAFDWPGLGYSEAPRSDAADPDALAGQLGAILDALGLDRVDLVGADMGGPPALVFAARHPERVGTAVVLSSLLFGDDATSIEISVMRRAGLASAAFRFAPGLVYARCKQTFLPDGEELDDAIDADFAGAFHRPEVRAYLAKMCAGYERALPHLPDRYWTIRRPVRLLWARDDGHFPPGQAERLCAILPEARCEIVEGARHWMALSRANEVADRIDALLSEGA